MVTPLRRYSTKTQTYKRKKVIKKSVAASDCFVIVTIRIHLIKIYYNHSFFIKKISKLSFFLKLSLFFVRDVLNFSSNLNYAKAGRVSGADRKIRITEKQESCTG